MERELTYAEKARIYDKFLREQRAQMTLNPQRVHDAAIVQYKEVLRKHAAGEKIDIPPPVKRRPVKNPPQ